MVTYKIRLARTEDMSRICQIERSATARFGSVEALAHLVDGDVLSESTVQRWLETGTIYGVTDTSSEDDLLGFAALHLRDGYVYLAEISVLGNHQGSGLGGLLLNAVFDHARKEGTRNLAKKAVVTLTTYPEVKWNGPWYRKYGFREIDASELGPEHVQKMTTDETERALVQPGYRRCCMVWEESI